MTDVLPGVWSDKKSPSLIVTEGLYYMIPIGIVPKVESQFWKSGRKLANLFGKMEICP